MAGLDLTAFSDVLKIVFPRQLRDQLNSEVKAWKRWKRVGAEVWEGRDNVEWPLRVGRNEGMGFGRPGGPIPEAGKQSYTKLQVPLREFWARMFIDAVTMKVSRSNRGSFKRGLQSEQDGLRQDVVDFFNEVLWRDGRGVLALVDGAGSGAVTLGVDAPGGVAGDDNGCRFLQKDALVAILSTDGSTLQAVRRIDGISADGTTVTFNSAVSSTQAPDNGLIVRAPNLNVTSVDDTSFNREFMGLLGMVDDGTFVNNFHNVNRTLFPVFQSAVFSSVGALDLDTMQQAFDVADQLGNGKISEIWCHHSVRRSYLALLVANRRYLSSGGTNKHDGGFTGQALSSDIEFGGVPIMVDKDAPYGTMFFVDPRYMVRMENTPGEWVNEDGAILDRVRGVDAFEAVWRSFGNFTCERANASARLDGIDSSKVIIHVR